MKYNYSIIGRVVSAVGSKINVEINENIDSSLLFLDGYSYRLGQIGSYLKIPLGYKNLYGVCTQIGANPSPPVIENEQSEIQTNQEFIHHRWLTVVLFGESIGEKFERGVSDYPIIGDEVHLVVENDLRIIYNQSEKGTINIGNIASSSGIAANVNIKSLVSRHSAVVGSTGSGKSNLVAVCLEKIIGGGFENSRVIVIDPHGEYSNIAKDKCKVFSVAPEGKPDVSQLQIPYWALPFNELNKIGFGELTNPESVRAVLQEMKIESSKFLKSSFPKEIISADSPIPFNIKELWYRLDFYENSTFTDSERTKESLIKKGDAEKLISAEFNPPNPGNKAPFANKQPRGIQKNLNDLKTRLKDKRLAFLFNLVDGLMPTLDGKTKKDLDTLVSSWIGHEKPLTIFDMSGISSEILQIIVGVLFQLIYEIIFWGQKLPIGGKQQPLLIVIDEAHLFIPEGDDAPAHRIISKIAK